ncbi:MAG: GNAT family N-acetyltransferase [Acetobacteraceae bacterium]
MIDTPGFTTARLVLRPREMTDLEACVAMDRDPEVTRFVAGPWRDPLVHRAFVAERINFAFPPGMGYWSILSADGFLGWILLAPLDLRGPEIEIGWRLVRRGWGLGYATEAARPVLAHALGALELPLVVADIDPDNRASVKVVRKLGLRYLGPIAYHGRMVERYIARRSE